MKTIILWVWAFWFAVIRHIAMNHPNEEFYAYEKDSYSQEYLSKHRKSPFFFTDIELPRNIILVKQLNDVLPTIDLIILAIPNQFIDSSIHEIKDFLKSWVCFLNLSKGIDNSSLRTVSDTLNTRLPNHLYQYGVLSGGMIARELIDGFPLWAQIGITDIDLWERIKTLFQNSNLQITLSQEYKNIELYGALKNIIAMYTWYLEGKWYGYSSIWYYLCSLIKELPLLVKKLWWSADRMDFHQFALGWDIIATCFWDSRNRLFWKKIWEWMNPNEAMIFMKNQKKHVEWYDTLKWLHEMILSENSLSNFQKIIKIFL